MSKSLGLLSASHQLLDVETMGDASPSCNFTGSLRTFVWIYHISFCFGYSFLNIKKLFGRIQELLKKIALFGRFLDQNGLQRQKSERLSFCGIDNFGIDCYNREIFATHPTPPLSNPGHPGLLLFTPTF